MAVAIMVYSNCFSHFPVVNSCQRKKLDINQPQLKADPLAQVPKPEQPGQGLKPDQLELEAELDQLGQGTEPELLAQGPETSPLRRGPEPDQLATRPNRRPTVSISPAHLPRI